MQPTILLVEDDAVLRRGLAELFTREGCRVIEAASVREAKEKLNGEVQAVVLDVGLPDGDGVTLCRQWRERGEQRPILFLTAKDGEPLPLTLTEYKIVKMLMERRGVVPRNLLLEVLWDDGSKFIDDNTLSVHMSRLREKIGAEHIKTIRGVGYQWSDT